MVGAWAWAERRLYEVVGAWAPSTAYAAAKIWFASVSQHHAWRAQQWEERLPGRLVPAYPPPDAAAAWSAPGPEPAEPAEPAAAEAALTALARLDGDGARLGAYCRVILPRTVVAYRSWQRLCTACSDRPLARVLALQLADVTADWHEGSQVLLDLLDEPGGTEELSQIARASTEVERLLVGHGRGPNSPWSP